VHIQSQIVEELKSLLQVKMDKLAKNLTYLSTLAIIAIAILTWLLGRPLLEIDYRIFQHIEISCLSKY